MDQSARQFLHKRRKVVAFAALLVVVVSWWYILRPDTNSSGGQSFFYDLGANQLFIDSSLKNPPIKAPSGGEGVLAHVFTLSDPTNTKDKFVAFLEKYTPQYKKQLDDAGAAEGMVPPGMGMQYRLIRSIESDEWVPLESPQGRKLLAEIEAKNRAKGKVVPCVP